MMRARIGLVAAIAALAAGGAFAATAVAAPGGQGAANAANSPTLLKKQVSGYSKNNKSFTGTYAIHGFVVRTVNGKRGVYAVGTLKGMLKGRHISRSNVLVPASLQNASSTPKPATKSTRQAASCQLLHLLLGPITLNLLGLHLTIGGGTGGNLPILVDLTAVSGTPGQGGGLLGNLLCGLDNALNGTGALATLSSDLQQLAATLTSLASLAGAA